MALSPRSQKELAKLGKLTKEIRDNVFVENTFQDTFFSMEEIKKHNKPGDLWIVVHGNVYDVSEFADTHPGGADTFFENSGGVDATDRFEDAFHSEAAKKKTARFIIGHTEGYVGDGGGLPCSIITLAPESVEPPVWWYLLSMLVILSTAVYTYVNHHESILYRLVSGLFGNAELKQDL